VVIGQHGALVIDAGINPAMAQQIQQAVRRLTDRPILWLANTVYHGDHTFGNAAFPAATKIIASRQTAQSMTDLDAEKRARAQNLDGNLDAIADVTRWRQPDVVFEERTEVDLGGRTVQLWQFGPGNSPGDTVVWVPEARAAWTGNLLGHRRVTPMLLEGGPAPYIDTLARFKSTLEVKTVVPGHGPLADARALDAWMAYLRELLEGVTGARRLGLSALATVETVPLPRGHGFPRWHPAARVNWLVQDLHRLNVLATYRDLERQPTAA
jgi:cyclase